MLCLLNYEYYSIEQTIPQEEFFYRTLLKFCNKRHEKITTTTARAVFPCPTAFDTKISNDTTRMSKNIKLTQFPINIADARTVHKLQERSLENLLVSNWSYTSNWI